jgi:hypothetical protein
MQRKVALLVAVIVAVAVGLRIRVELLSGMSGLPATALAIVAVAVVAAAVVVLFRHRKHLFPGDRRSHHT